MDERELTGRVDTHVVAFENSAIRLHHAVTEPFRALRAAAARDGFVLIPVSGFRNLARQAHIWNAKFRGHRPVHDRLGRELDPGQLGDEELVEAILVWSALPGASRHHWGTDIDVYDRVALSTRLGPRVTA